MGYLALFVFAVLGHTASSKSWGGYDFHRPMGNHHHPTANHDRFNYNTWCHSAGGWDGNHSWEDSSSNESNEWNGDKNRPLRSTTTRRSVVINKTQTEGTSSISIRLSSTGSTPSPLEVLLCLRMCPITSEYNPVCGTDNITYWNPGRLQCAMSCGINVSLRNPSACTSANLDANDPNNPPTPLSPQVIAACIRSCQVTSEYNPVCGTDFITYDNPSRLECAKGCGKPISLLVKSRCPPPDQLTSTTTTTTTSTTTTTISPQVLATCMRSCSVTSEYNPVCGTDSITYSNPSRLECAKGCGKPVSMLLPSRCPSPDQFTSTSTTSSTPASPSSISSTSSTSTTPMTSTSTSATPTSPASTAAPPTRFTIAQHILDAIFNGDNSTTESIPDFSLDERYED